MRKDGSLRSLRQPGPARETGMGFASDRRSARERPGRGRRGGDWNRLDRGWNGWLAARPFRGGMIAGPQVYARWGADFVRGRPRHKMTEPGVPGLRIWGARGGGLGAQICGSGSGSAVRRCSGLTEHVAAGGGWGRAAVFPDPRGIKTVRLRRLAGPCAGCPAEWRPAATPWWQPGPIMRAETTQAMMSWTISP